MTIWKHIRAVLLLPGVVTILVPATILWRNGIDTLDLWAGWPVRIGLEIFGLMGITGGLVLMIATNRMFATLGQGTLAPWNPTQRLVVDGVYRRVRNPMISGVFMILLGESLLAASRPLFYWFLVFVAINMIFIPLLEEPDLHRRFGADYAEYCRHVPRWIPRLKPWTATTERE
jgi:protein-S-isoprenylcysteine O-methyltransferase Ste14